jgi:hypothetical protein
MLSRSKLHLRRPRIICRPIILSATFRRTILSAIFHPTIRSAVTQRLPLRRTRRSHRPSASKSGAQSHA